MSNDKFVIEDTILKEVSLENIKFVIDSGWEKRYCNSSCKKNKRRNNFSGFNANI